MMKLRVDVSEFILKLGDTMEKSSAYGYPHDLSRSNAYMLEALSIINMMKVNAITE